MGAAFFTSAGEIQAEVEKVVGSGVDLIGPRWEKKEIPFDKPLKILC